MNRQFRWHEFVAVCFVLVLLSAACGAPGTAVPTEEPVMEEPADMEDTAGDEDAGEDAGEEESPPVEPTQEAMEDPGLEPLPPEPQSVPFPAADGYEQMGMYYPGAKNPGPLVVLMHWAPGDASDWDAIAPWLQNRGLAGPDAPDPSQPWLDSSWFPEMGEENSFGVFTFSFRGCSNGCAEFDRSGWLNDAYGAYEAARVLPGVDPEQIVFIGASIGADGAVNACLEGCQGSMSLSPGNYLGVDYVEAVKAVEELGVPAWCLAAESDTPAYNACTGAEGELYRSVIHPGSDHGMALIQPGVYDPDTMALMIEFLDLTIGLE